LPQGGEAGRKDLSEPAEHDLKTRSYGFAFGRGLGSGRFWGVCTATFWCIWVIK
jgi:hypothetical protein